MAEIENYDVLVLGSGQGGQLIAWHLAQAGRRTALVERRWIGGACPNIACMPSKTEIWSARVAQLARQGEQFGMVTGPIVIDMESVLRRKRDMVRHEMQLHLQGFEASGTELILGEGHFAGPKTLRVQLNDGGTRVVSADQVFLNLGTHAAIPEVRGLNATSPLTHIEALELDYAPGI